MRVVYLTFFLPLLTWSEGGCVERLGPQDLDLDSALRDVEVQMTSPLVRPGGSATGLAGDPADGSKRPRNPATLLLTGAIRLYQEVVSSQNVPECQYYPSCSHFGMEAIRTCGAFRGVLLAADRVSRCNRFSTYASDWDPVRRKFVDPVGRYVPSR